MDTLDPDIRNPIRMGWKFIIVNISYNVYKKVCMGDLAKMFRITRDGYADPWCQFIERAIVLVVHVDVQYLSRRTSEDFVIIFALTIYVLIINYTLLREIM